MQDILLSLFAIYVNKSTNYLNIAILQATILVCISGSLASENYVSENYDSMALKVEPGKCLIEFETERNLAKYLLDVLIYRKPPNVSSIPTAYGADIIKTMRSNFENYVYKVPAWRLEEFRYIMQESFESLDEDVSILTDVMQILGLEFDEKSLEDTESIGYRVDTDHQLVSHGYSTDQTLMSLISTYFNSLFNTIDR